MSIPLGSVNVSVSICFNSPCANKATQKKTGQDLPECITSRTQPAVRVACQSDLDNQVEFRMLVSACANPGFYAHTVRELAGCPSTK